MAKLSVIEARKQKALEAIDRRLHRIEVALGIEQAEPPVVPEGEPVAPAEKPAEAPPAEKPAA